MVIVNQDRGMPDIGLWLYALTQHSMTNRYAALNENMIYHCPHDVVPLYEKRLYSAFQFMHQLRCYERWADTLSAALIELQQAKVTTLQAYSFAHNEHGHKEARDHKEDVYS